MSTFKPIDLSGHFNAAPKPGKTSPWHPSMADRYQVIPRGDQSFWGIPFHLGPESLTKKGYLLIGARRRAVTVLAKGRATHVCIIHFCNAADDRDNAAGGEHLADYVLHYADGSEHVQPIRRRFEVNRFAWSWGGKAFGAAPLGMYEVTTPETRMGWGHLQTGVTGGHPFGAWVYALENPHPRKRLAAITLRPVGGEPIGILGVTLYDGPGHPLRHVPRRAYRLVLPASEKTTTKALDTDVDMGCITRVYAAPAARDDAWLKATEAGLGAERRREGPGREFLMEITASPGATVTARSGKRRPHKIDFGSAWKRGRAASDRGARLQLLHPRTTWLHVTVKDASTGKPTPTRIQFSGPRGEYLPPYGHHGAVNDNWFEDYGGDLQLGANSYAYVPGKFQIELPVGEVYVEMAKGFEYAPVRRRLEIYPGQRTLELAIDRWTDRRKAGWVTADTHVHFISPQTAWLEGQGESLNLINLLASQWGRLFTNVADITGELSGCSADDTLVWVGTENRHHLLGHISMLGAHGDPVFPMCAGGPNEAFLGDPDVTTLTEWAETCKQRDGVVIRPHFPSPICEEPVYFALGKLDGAELRQYANPDAETLDEFCFTEWYRYLNCGYRVAAVGGTDKMSAGMPVGGARTYAQLGRSDGFSFANWGKAVRAGRTFTTSGPIIDITVEGRGMGEQIDLPAGGGTLEVHARAECAWPIHALEIVVNGKVAARTDRKNGAKSLSLKRSIKMRGSGWIAARCGSRLRAWHCWPIHLGAHTSSVYVVADKAKIFSPSDASYMLTLIDGGLTYLDTLSVRYEEERHRQMKAIFNKARAKIHAKLHASGRAHGH